MEQNHDIDSKNIILLEFVDGFNEVFLLKYGENIVRFNLTKLIFR